MIFSKECHIIPCLDPPIESHTNEDTRYAAEETEGEGRGKINWTNIIVVEISDRLKTLTESGLVSLSQITILSLLLFLMIFSLLRSLAPVTVPVSEVDLSDRC